MPKRRELFRLAEVEIELGRLFDRNIPQILLTDLQQGSLHTVVAFPRFRNGRTNVPAEAWTEVDLQHFASRPGKRSDYKDFELSAELFVEGERNKLRGTTIAVFRRNEDELHPDYATHFRTLGTLKSEMLVEDWEALLLRCFRWQRALSEESSDVLVPMVTSEEFESYLAQVRADLGPTKGSPGRKPAIGWLAIYGEAIRQLGKNPTHLNDGNVRPFAKALNQWAIGIFGKNAGVPTEDTIAERLRDIRDGKWKS